MQTNTDQTPGYGTDKYTEHAKELIKEACGAPEARVYFLVGGTQTNSTVIDGVLARHEGVLCAESGHINVHETGAIEATGHKVITVPNEGGKLTKENLLKVLSTHTDEHMVKPRLVYISNSTENGAVYYLDELQELYQVCKENNLYFFIDGARLGVALTDNYMMVPVKTVTAIIGIRR